MFPESFKGVSRKFQGCFEEVLRVFKKDPMVFQGILKAVSIEF